jgi:hypothetical protein
MTAETVRHEALRYLNEDFAIYHVIADCPPFTAVRELTKNAEENACLLSPPGRIEWFAEVVEGVRKIGLYNEGPGMSGDSLSRLMDLASTGKTLGADNNFGQGGKISALKVSPQGVVYRSCKGGRVSQLVLAAEPHPGLDYPVYVKRRQPVRDEEGESWEVVVDVTAAYAGRPDRPLDRDWTEVVLLGRDARHDTVAELIPGLSAKNWLMRLINTRFFRFAPDVTIHAANLTTGQQAGRNATGLEDLTLKHAERHEDVNAVHPRHGPVTIRYVKLKGSFGVDSAGNSRAKTMEAYGVGSRGDHVCLVWKNECYDVHTSWSRISGPFGFTFGSSNVAVQILLPDGAPVKNNTYRDALIDRNGEHQPVRVEEFAELVRLHRPDWLIAYIEEEARKNTNQAGVMERLKSFLEELRAAPDKRPEVEPGGDDQGELPHRPRGRGQGNGGNGRHTHDPTAEQHRPAQGRRIPSQRCGIPSVSFASDPAILEEMRGRAAMYRREENAVLLNPQHFKYLEDLDKIYAEAGPDAERRALAKQLFDDEYCFNAGKFVVLSWLFKGKADWDDREWQESLSMGALTFHLAAPDSLDQARRRFRQKLTTRKVGALASA